MYNLLQLRPSLGKQQDVLIQLLPVACIIEHLQDSFTAHLGTGDVFRESGLLLQCQQTLNSFTVFALKR